MPGLLPLNDQDLMQLISMQRYLTGGSLPVQYNPNPYNLPGITVMPEDTPLVPPQKQQPPPVPQRNPKRKAVEDAVSPQDLIDAIYLEQQIRQGHTSPPYPMQEYEGAPAKKRKSMKAV